MLPINFLSAFTAVLLISCQCSARTSPAGVSTSAAAAPSNASQEYLQAHNEARSEVGVGPLAWSDELAKSASLTARLQRDKHECNFADLSNSKYGVNQLFASGTEMAPRAVVANWVMKKRSYNYANNSCTTESCGVYTQVVWKKSAELGCAQAACAKDRSSLTICFYNPPGNIVGEKPY